MSDNLVQVGDTIVVDNCFGVRKFTVTRVTKTLALCKLPIGYEVKFQRNISNNMSYPRDIWNMTKYSVIRGTTNE